MIYIILVLGLGLRLLSINQSLWLDEAANVVASTQYSFWDFITKYPIGDFHPPGYFAILWVWGHLFGISELSVRLPSVFFGVATIFVIYKIGQKLLNQKTGLLAALFLAISPLHLYYSQEARMYSMSAFAVSLSFYFLIQLVENYQSRKNFYFYSLSIIIVLYSDYVAYLILPVQLLWVFWQRREKSRKVFLAQFVGLLVLSPWFLIFPKQLANGRQLAIDVPGWRMVVGGTAIKDVGLVWIKLLIGRISFENKLIYIAIVGAVSLLYVIALLPLIKKMEKNVLLIFCWFGLPIILALIASFFIPILSYFRLLFIVPSFALLLAMGLNKFSKRWQFSAICLVLVINFVFCSIYLFNPRFHRENWKGMVGFLDADAKPQNIVLLENNDLPAPFSYYYQYKIQAHGALSHFPANSGSDVINLEELLQNKNKVYLVDYLIDISDPQRLVAKKLNQVGFHQTRIDNFNGVGFVYEYERR